MTTILRTATSFEREPLSRPFGFKGGYVSEIWQTATLLASGTAECVGLGTQSVLWSDPAVFAAHSADEGNELMYAVSAFAAQCAVNVSFESPLDLLDELYPAVSEYARDVTHNEHLRKTFVLNALVGLDNAAWMIYAAENGLSRFDDIIPPECQAALSHRHAYVAGVPTVSFGTPDDEIQRCATDGALIVKVKLGHPGTQEEMLGKDLHLIERVHAFFGVAETEHTSSGKALYYLDANGRYESAELLKRLIDRISAIGLLDRVAIIEEPFPESMEIDVSGFGVRIAADESAHTDEDARRRIDMGYGAIALKPVAKTLSMTFRIARVAYERGIPCFCADLTVNPILVDWNKNIAARLKPLPGLQIGLLEANGRQNYLNWEMMERYHPAHGAPWTTPRDGIYELTDSFYEQAGGIFETPAHYRDLVRT